MHVQDMTFVEFRKVLAAALPGEFAQSVLQASEAQPLSECGLDSLANAEMQMQIEEVLDVWVTCEQLSAATTFGEIFAAAKDNAKAPV